VCFYAAQCIGCVISGCDIMRSGMSPAAAEMSYLKKAATLDTYGIDMHHVLVSLCSVQSAHQGRRSLWDREDTSPQYLDWGNIITNAPPPIFQE